MGESEDDVNAGHGAERRKDNRREGKHAGAPEHGYESADDGTHEHA